MNGLKNKLIAGITFGIMIFASTPIHVFAGGGGGGGGAFADTPIIISKKSDLLNIQQVAGTMLSDGSGKGGGFTADQNLPAYKAMIEKSKKQSPVSKMWSNIKENVSDSFGKTRLKNDLENVTTGAELSNKMKNSYIAALGGLPKFQDINIPTSLNLIRKNPPKMPSMAKYDYRLPAPAIDKAALQNKFISGLNTEDELTRLALEKFKQLHNMN